MFNVESYVDKVDERYLKSLVRYGTERTPVGDFLTAVLRNDLQMSLARADEVGRSQLLHIAQFVYNEMPALCWGSKQKVRDWVYPEQA